MIERKVTKTKKSSEGVIEGLCGAWGDVSKTVAVLEIQAQTHRYYTEGPSGQVDIIVVKGTSENYLRTEPDLTKADNLASLPDC